MRQVVAKGLLMYCVVPYFRLVLGLIYLLIAPFYFTFTAIEWTCRVVTAGLHRIKAGHSPAPLPQ